MDDQRSLEEQLLGDMSYDDPRKKQQAGGVDPRLAGASAPMLDDMGAGSAAPPPKPQSRYQQLTAEQIAVLQQQRAEKDQPPYTEEEIAELQAEYIERQRIQFQQQAMEQQAAAAQSAADILLEDTSYTAPEKKKTEALPQVDASALLEEAAPEPERRVVFNQEDLEAAKKAAAKRNVESLTSAPPASADDQKEARRQMEALRQQQLADLAQAGFPVSIILTIVGVIAGACMAFFAVRPFAEDFESNLFFDIATKFYQFGGIALALLSITIVLRVQALKGFTSFLFGLSSVLLLIPGIVLLFQKKAAGGFGLTAGLFVIAIVCCFAVTFVISTSDKLGAYYGHKEIMYD